MLVFCLSQVSVNIDFTRKQGCFSPLFTKSCFDQRIVFTRGFGLEIASNLERRRTKTIFPNYYPTVSPCSFVSLLGQTLLLDPLLILLYTSSSLWKCYISLSYFSQRYSYIFNLFKKYLIYYFQEFVSLVEFSGHLASNTRLMFGNFGNC